MKGGIFNARSDKEEMVLMHAGAILTWVANFLIAQQQAAAHVLI
jgi:hypothetical protein